MSEEIASDDVDDAMFAYWADEEANALIEFLMNHENDIYNQIDDFGELASLFEAVFTREPSGEN